MNLNYTKAVLYAYPNIEAVKEQIDDFVERKALASMNDYSPCDEQCEKIIEYMAQKIILNELKAKIRGILASLSDLELDMLEYKYFKTKPKRYFAGMDTDSRNYFRRQKLLIEKISNMCDRVFLTNEWFEKHCLKMGFFRELLRRVEQYDQACNKNKRKTACSKKADDKGQNGAENKDSVKLIA